MFVDPEMRGLGLGKRLLVALEEVAWSEKTSTIRLETGVKQPDAIGLYRKCGYRERGPFGRYEPDPLSVFFEKLREK